MFCPSLDRHLCLCLRRVRFSDGTPLFKFQTYTYMIRQHVLSIVSWGISMRLQASIHISGVWCQSLIPSPLRPHLNFLCRLSIYRLPQVPFMCIFRSSSDGQFNPHNFGVVHGQLDHHCMFACMFIWIQPHFTMVILQI